MSSQPHLHLSLAPLLPLIVERELARYGKDAVRRIVLIGSSIRASEFHDESDIDIVVLVADDAPSPNRSIDCPEIPSEWECRLEVTKKKFSDVERMKNYEFSYNGQVARGIILYDSGSKYEGEVLDADECRRREVIGHLRRAKLWIDIARSLLKMSSRETNSPLYRPEAAWEACRAVCWALHAVLINRDINPAPKTLRWNLDELWRLSILSEPLTSRYLRHLQPWIDRLPRDLAPLGYVDFIEIDDDDERLQQINRDREIVTAAAWCVRGIERLFMEIS